MKAPGDTKTEVPDQGINIPRRRRISRIRPWPLSWLIGLLILVVALMWLLGRV